MKNLSTILVLLMMLLSSMAYSQKTDYTQQENLVKNEISFEVLQVLNGVYQLSYERYIWNNFTGALGIGYKGKEGLIKLSGIDRERIKTDEIFYSGYQIAPEIRYYLKSTSNGQLLNGFYMGLYYKYSNYSSELNGDYISRSGTPYDLEFDMKLSISSVGFMIGYKLPISKHLNIDFMIAGPGAGNYNFQFINKKDLPQEFYEDFNEALEQYSILDFLNSDFRFSEIDNRSKFSTFSFRYGIAIGYTF